MTNEQKHTPTPWTINMKGKTAWIEPGICHSIFDNKPNEANATFIVTACNSHEMLVEALERIKAITGCVRSPKHDCNDIYRIANQALLKAGAL